MLVPGGVTLPAEGSEDAGAVQSIGARFAHGLVSLEEAADLGCRACGSPGGGCQFLGTAATAQVVGEALGLALPHSALAPSGEPVWLDIARRSALALLRLAARGLATRHILTAEASRTPCWPTRPSAARRTSSSTCRPSRTPPGSGCRPSSDWQRVNRPVPRLVDALPNGPRNHPTVRVFLAGGVPEVILHLRRMGLLDVGVLTVTGETLGEVLDWWESSERRRRVRERLREADGVDPDDVIMSPDSARRPGSPGHDRVSRAATSLPAARSSRAPPSTPRSWRTTSTGTAGPARVFTSERDAIGAIKGLREPPVRPGDVLVLAGRGPLGSGMEEIYQITSALKFLPGGRPSRC